jgi:DNA-binding NtrC family response regulator
LLVSTSPTLTDYLRQVLQQAHWEVTCVPQIAALSSLASTPVWPLVFVVNDTPAAVLETWTAEITAERTVVIVITEQPTAQEAMQLTRLGAAGYFPWPVPTTKLLELAERAHRTVHYARHDSATAANRSSSTSPVIAQGCFVASAGPAKVHRQEPAILHAPSPAVPQHNICLDPDVGTLFSLPRGGSRK